MKKLLFATVLLLSGCMGPTTPHKIDNVRRVFMHQPGHYSVLVQDGAELKIKDFPSHNTKLIMDAKDGKMWVEGHKYNDQQLWSQVIIHITSEKDIEGGGFKLGKSPEGKTNVVK